MSFCEAWPRPLTGTQTCLCSQNQHHICIKCICNEDFFLVAEGRPSWTYQCSSVVKLLTLVHCMTILLGHGIEMHVSRTGVQEWGRGRRCCHLCGKGLSLGSVCSAIRQHESSWHADAGLSDRRRNLVKADVIREQPHGLGTASQVPCHYLEMWCCCLKTVQSKHSGHAEQGMHIRLHL